MHEGEVLEPLQIFKNDPVEYPPVPPLGHRWPEIIAYGTVLPGHTTPFESGERGPFEGDPTNPTLSRQFGTVCAYDGLVAGVGRVVTDSSFHHFLDLNLTGDPLGVGFKTSGFQNNTQAGNAVLEGMKSYYRNIAFWLARQRHFFPYLFGFIIAQAWWGKVFNPHAPVESKPEQILQYGTLMRQGLARHVSDAMTIDYVRTILVDAGFTGLLPDQPWKQRQESPAPFTNNIVNAALGGAAMELMSVIAKSPSSKLSMEQAQAVASKGMRTAMRALKRFLLENAKKIEEFARLLEK
jgi:hypothetical protein